MKNKEKTDLRIQKKKPGRNRTWGNPPFAIKVNVALAKKGMYQKDLARILGVTQSYVSQNIYGDKNDEKLKERICMVLGIKCDGKKVSGE